MPTGHSMEWVGRTRAKTTWAPRRRRPFSSKNLVSQNCPPRVPAAINTPSFFLPSEWAAKNFTLNDHIFLPFRKRAHMAPQWNLQPGDRRFVRNRCLTAATHLLKWFNLTKQPNSKLFSTPWSGPMFPARAPSANWTWSKTNV